MINVGPIRFSGALIELIDDSRKRATRRILTPGNTIVKPGKFENVLLETARAKRAAGENYLRARCQFDAGPRTVDVRSKFSPGDLLWVRKGQEGGTRRSSLFTLSLHAVDVARLQDMTHADAAEEGVDDYRAFKALWIGLMGERSWRSNPWVWIYRFFPHRINIDELLRQREIKSSL